MIQIESDHDFGENSWSEMVGAQEIPNAAAQGRQVCEKGQSGAKRSAACPLGAALQSDTCIYFSVSSVAEHRNARLSQSIHTLRNFYYAKKSPGKNPCGSSPGASFYPVLLFSILQVTPRPSETGSPAAVSPRPPQSPPPAAAAVQSAHTPAGSFPQRAAAAHGCAEASFASR